MADKFGITDHCIELKEPCPCGGTGHFLLLEPNPDRIEARVAGGWACSKCFGRGGQSPFPVGSWVSRRTKKAWNKISIADLIALKKIYIKPVKEPLTDFSRDTGEIVQTGILKEFMTSKKS